jgi:hypothetical protein
MNILIVIVLAVIVALWLVSVKTGGNLKLPLFIMVVLALVLVALNFITQSGTAAMSSDVFEVELAAGYELGEELQLLDDGPILVLTWMGHGYNPAKPRVEGLKKAIGDSRRVIMGGVYLEGMKVGDDFIKIDPLNFVSDLKSYLADNTDIAGVVALRPLLLWDGLEGLDAPPFFIFAGTSDWKPFMESGLVKAAMVASLRERDADEEQPSDFSTPEYKLVRGL